MKLELREGEIELVPENELERDALVKVHRAGTVKVKAGRTTDRGYPPDYRKTNVILVLPDPNNWGS